MTLGALIVRMRGYNNMSQKQLAAAMGVNEPVLSRWENNDRIPHFDVMERMALVLKCRLNDFATLVSGPQVVQIIYDATEPLAAAKPVPKKAKAQPKAKAKPKARIQPKAKSRK